MHCRIGQFSAFCEGAPLPESLLVAQVENENTVTVVRYSALGVLKIHPRATSKNFTKRLATQWVSRVGDSHPKRAS